MAGFIVCKHSNRVQEFLRHTKGKLMLTCHLASQKTTDEPKSPGLVNRVLHKQQTTSSSKTRFSYQERSQRSHELREHIDLQINQIVSHDKFFLHEEVKGFQTGNISKQIKAWEKSQRRAISWIK